MNQQTLKGVTLLSLLLSIALSSLLITAALRVWQHTHQHWHLKNTINTLEQEADIVFKLIGAALQKNHPDAPIQIETSDHFHGERCCQNKSDSLIFSVKAHQQLHPLCQPSGYPPEKAIGFWLFIRDQSLKCKAYNPETFELLDHNAMPLVFGLHRMRIHYGFERSDGDILFRSAANTNANPPANDETLTALVFEITMESTQTITNVIAPEDSLAISQDHTLLSRYQRWFTVKQYE